MLGAKRLSDEALEELLAERYDLGTAGFLRPLTPSEAARLEVLEAALRAHNEGQSAPIDYSKADRLDAYMQKLDEYLRTNCTTGDL
ncbi:MAG: hypothetical protein U0Q16_30935 [Bryobacteraceae bacterium]